MSCIGVLGLQGDFEAHLRALGEIDRPTRVIRRPAELDDIAGLILPGGESTTLIKLLRDTGLAEAIVRFHSSGRAIFGTCAGAILLAGRVVRPEQFSLGLIDIEIERNAYGRQRDSFETIAGRLEARDGSGDPAWAREDSMELVMIRAPKILRCGPSVSILVRHGEEPVLVRQGSVLAGTFHPELGPDRRVHSLFARMAERALEAA